MEIAGLRAVSPGTERQMDGKTLHRGSVSFMETESETQLLAGVSCSTKVHLRQPSAISASSAPTSTSPT